MRKAMPPSAMLAVIFGTFFLIQCGGKPAGQTPSTSATSSNPSTTTSTPSTAPATPPNTASADALPAPPANATVFDNIEETTDNWRDCSDCAGGTITTNYWTQLQSSPAMSGSSRQFYNGGGGWADVLWYKSLGNQNLATNFLWDFYVYFDESTASNVWSAEYDLYQSIAGVELMIGSQCAFGDGHWDIWDQAAGHWVSTTIACPRFTPGTWHHIQWYMQRVSSTQYRYDTLVVDGQEHVVNQTFSGSTEGWADVLGVQWQLDLSSNGVPASEWIDNVKLTIW